MNRIIAAAWIAISLLGIAPSAAIAREHARATTAPEIFAQCLASRKPDLIGRGIRANWAPEYYPLQVTRDGPWECAKLMPLSFGPDLRYLLAQAALEQGGMLVRRFDFRSVPPLRNALIGGDLLFLDAVKPGDQDPKEVQKQALAKDQVLSEVGECTVRADPEQARQFLAAPDEQKLLDRVVATVRSCTPPNTQIAFVRETLTGMVALSYLRLAYAAEDLMQPAKR